MMAARAGAEHVYACEAFAPLAELADQITFINTPSQITVMPIMSTRIAIDPAAAALVSTDVECDENIVLSMINLRLLL